MYQYDEHDQRLVEQRVQDFRQQTHRYLKGDLSDEQFKSLRLMNGLYQELHAPMLRVNIPYGELSSDQLRRLAHIAREYDRGYGHVTTRQNMQFNWPKLERVPDILEDLAVVQMHAIQSSGNCIRNTTSDHLAGITAQEIEDPRPYCELIRQWSTLHPEFSYLPRKFKIAVSGSARDRAAVQVHDIGLYLVKNQTGEVGFKVYVGGGQGRTPIIAEVIKAFLPKQDLLTYLDAIVRTYNLLGRRDNKYKARIKILVKAMGIDAFKTLVEKEWQLIKGTELKLHEVEITNMKRHFRLPVMIDGLESFECYLTHPTEPLFTSWVKQNTVIHKQAGYRAVYVSLKAPGIAPGDISAEQMEKLADISDQFSFGEIRTTHNQNLLLPYVLEADLFELWSLLSPLNLATANIGTLTDIICCPGQDYCSLANATSIPLAHQINQRFQSMDMLHSLGDIQIKISGCMNACGHHHVGHIGILGVDKKGEEWYQVTLGGSASEDTRIGQRIGPAFAKDKVVDAIEQILFAYIDERAAGENFVQTLDRVGIEPFKAAAYTNLEKAA